MKKLFWRVAIWLMPFGVFGCSTPPSVILQSCPIPEALDYVAQGPTDILISPLPARDAVNIWAKERHLHKVLADDYNDLVTHVKRDCQ